MDLDDTTKTFSYTTSPNALNSLRRDCMLEVVVNEMPEIHIFVQRSYSSGPISKFGINIIMSKNGLRKYDPLCLLPIPYTPFQ